MPYKLDEITNNDKIVMRRVVDFDFDVEVKSNQGTTEECMRQRHLQ